MRETGDFPLRIMAGSQGNLTDAGKSKCGKPEISHCGLWQAVRGSLTDAEKSKCGKSEISDCGLW